MKPVLFLKSAIAAICDTCFINKRTWQEESTDQTVTAKVWLKDRSVYEGPLLKHWLTYSRLFYDVFS